MGMRTDVVALLAALLLFAVAPQLDLWVADAFYDPQRRFFLEGQLWVRAIYRGTPLVTAGLALALLAVILAGILRLSVWARRNGRAAAFVLWAFLLGPGLMVNAVFKAHWGRARPAQVQQFGGTARFTPALQPAGECRHNCSFVSGHASIGFGLFAFAFVLPRQRSRWILAALAAGCTIGLARMAQGGHFLSDVVFSALVTWFCTRAVARSGLYLSLLRRRRMPALSATQRLPALALQWLLLGPDPRGLPRRTRAGAGAPLPPAAAPG